MGNIDSRAKHGDTILYVHMNQPYFYPGNRVHGKIYIRTAQELEPAYLEVVVKGSEKIQSNKI